MVVGDAHADQDLHERGCDRLDDGRAAARAGEAAGGIVGPVGDLEAGRVHCDVDLMTIGAQGPDETRKPWLLARWHVSPLVPPWDRTVPPYPRACMVTIETFEHSVRQKPKRRDTPRQTSPFRLLRLPSERGLSGLHLDRAFVRAFDAGDLGPRCHTTAVWALLRPAFQQPRGPGGAGELGVLGDEVTGPL